MASGRTKECRVRKLCRNAVSDISAQQAWLWAGLSLITGVAADAGAAGGLLVESGIGRRSFYYCSSVSFICVSKMRNAGSERELAALTHPDFLWGTDIASSLGRKAQRCQQRTSEKPYLPTATANSADFPDSDAQGRRDDISWAGLSTQRYMSAAAAI